MPYSERIVTDNPKYADLTGVIMCACGVPATGLFRGTRWGQDMWGRDKRIPCNRWLCEQCHGNLLDDDAILKQRKTQRLTPEQEAAWDRWYDDHGSEL